MKNLFYTLTMLFFLGISSNTLTAQETLFGDLFNQLSFEEQTELLQNLNINLDSAALANPGDFPFNLDSLLQTAGLLDSLGVYLDSLPALDDDYLDALDLLNDTIDMPDVDDLFLNFGQLDSLSADTIVGEVGNISSIFEINYDSLDNIIHGIDDDLNFSTNAPNSNGTNLTSLDILQDSINLSLFDSDIEDGAVGQILDQLFSSENFPDLEIAIGFQDASFQYYGADFLTQAKVIRLGSVPTFNNLWESRWHVQGSFLNQRIENFATDTENITTSNETGIFPYLYDGDFAMMISPTLFNNPNVRLTTSFGMEVGVYAPSHRDFDEFTQSRNNIGNTTGIGAQIGGGFSVKSGDMIVYTLATVAYGNVVDKQMDEDYRYNSLKLMAGVKIGEVANIRYSSGKQFWARNDNKRLDLNHQLTVGIILKELNRP